MTGAALRCVLVIANKRGLHARAAARFVKVAEQYDAEVVVAKNGQEVSGRSIMGLMMLAAARGCRVELRASGAEARQALHALAELVANRFHED